MLALKITCLGVSISLFTDSEDLYFYYLNKTPIKGQKNPSLQDDYPNITISNFSGNHYVEDNFVYVLTKDSIEFFSHDVIKNCVIMSKDRRHLYFPDITYIIVCMLSRLLNEQNMYILHSSVIERNNSAIVLLGDVGSGKTSIATLLCINNDFKLVANDHAIVGLKDDRPFVFAGTKTTNVRPGMLNICYPQISSIIKRDDNLKQWSSCIELNPYFNKLGINCSEQAYINDIVFLNASIDGKTGTFNPISKSNDINMFTLDYIKFMSESTRAYRNIMFSYKIAFPSFDTEYTNRLRVNYAMDTQKHCGTYKGNGSIKFICEQINQLN